MDENHKPADEIDRRAVDLSQAICDASDSADGADRLLKLASCLLELHTNALVRSGEFQRRIEELGKARASNAPHAARQLLSARPGDPGIEPLLFFANRPIGGE